MKLRTILVLVSTIIVSVTSLACSSLHSMASIHDDPHHAKSDPISGQWDMKFNADTGDVNFTREVKIKVDGENVTGTFESERTGSGTVKGTWSANKLTITLESEQGKMEVIALLKNGKLTGTWDVGHMQGKMEGAKKDSPAK